jgi:hypothetical protein
MKPVEATTRPDSGTALPGLAALALALLLPCFAEQRASGAASDCDSYSIGTALSATAGFETVVGGRSWVQTFTVVDTLISAVTVWQAAVWDTNINPMQLFFTRVDSTGRPLPLEILLAGPIVTVPYYEMGPPIPVRFEFEPPFELPSRGKFALAIKEATCAGTIHLMTDSLEVYPDGKFWRMRPNLGCEGLGCCTLPANGELIFTIELCLPSTPIRSTSWGAVKGQYR